MMDSVRIIYAPGKHSPWQSIRASGLFRAYSEGSTTDVRGYPILLHHPTTTAYLVAGGWSLSRRRSDHARLPDPFPNHTINQEGIDANQGYAEMLKRDSDLSQTARILKTTIDEYGDQGRGDVADLLARFQKIDGAKAEDLRRELHKASGEMLPYRLAPLGEGFREPTEEDKIAAAPKTPFGSAQGADLWAAGNMADVLLKKGDYADAVTHFRGEVARNPAEAMPYLAAVHDVMNEKNPALAAKFATQMDKAGLAAEAETKPERSGDGSILSAPIPPTITPGPIPPANPGETDIVIPAPQPGPEQKPETTPFPVPIPPAPEQQPSPQPTPTPEPPRQPDPQSPSDNTEKVKPQVRPPIQNPVVREDDAGHGGFGDSRDGGKRKHQGLDIKADPGAEVSSPVKGEVVGIGPAYKDPKAYGGEYQAIHIRGEDGRLYTMRYVSPTANGGEVTVKVGQKVSAGDPIGSVQDRARQDKNGRMENHIHVEIRDRSNRPVDPEPEFKPTRRRN